MPDYLNGSNQQQYAKAAQDMFAGMDTSNLPSFWQQGINKARQGKYSDQRVSRAFQMGAKMLNQAPKYSQNDIELGLAGIRKANRNMLDRSERMQQNNANAMGMIDSGISDNQLGQIRGQADNQLGQQINQAYNQYNTENYQDQRMREDYANNLLMGLLSQKTMNQANLATALAQADLSTKNQGGGWLGALSGGASGAAAGSSFGLPGMITGGILGAGAGYMG